MIKLSNHLLEVDDKIRFFARIVHEKLMEMLYGDDQPKRKRRRKIDRQLYELLSYLEQIDTLGYQMKLDIVTKKEVMNAANDKIKKKEQKARKTKRR